MARRKPTAARRRRQERMKRRRYRKRIHGIRCIRCARLVLTGLKSCARCLARLLESRTPELRHDREAHAAMLEAARAPGSRCQASGYTLEQLQSIGEELQVDRISPAAGYIIGNMQLLARSLNRAKWAGREVPEWAIHNLQLRFGDRASPW